MSNSYDNKSTVDEIKTRFDNDVERFSNLQTGQAASVDAPLNMELITKAAVTATSDIHRVLDIGCGAGNNTLKLLELVSPLDCTLVDLSLPMLERAKKRISDKNTGHIKAVQGDFRNVELPDKNFDVIMAAAVLHHLRDDRDWEKTFTKVFNLTAPGGSFWITDLVAQETESIHSMMWEEYGKYLESMGGPDYRKKVFAYVAKEDSPRPITYQIDLLRKVGFRNVEVLHLNSCFAAFGGIKD